MLAFFFRAHTCVVDEVGAREVMVARPRYATRRPTPPVPLAGRRPGAPRFPPEARPVLPTTAYAAFGVGVTAGGCSAGSLLFGAARIAGGKSLAYRCWSSTTARQQSRCTTNGIGRSRKRPPAAS